ncbi:hypothetical protein [Pseudomonas rhodesiae]|uniref:Uncharacterized protein n=1 Tax=Pseudomonas rhodesiae TaxID=76760 RepID=A0AAE8HAJ5_9PSED|nr:hypothetical protein [Pseudomonas rhodesiae]TWR53579.1 hypothetical protein FIV35_17840 [Pseudomonas rhodesiae]SDU98009.1 hypothetical protein SAMN04490209_1434 [Pseudomonas rhodesiae]
MTDQTQRLEIATVKAEVGSNILNRFSNDAIEADEIPTDSGPIPNLKQVMKVITDKASVSSSIYPTVAAGLAATAEGAIFLVASSEDDEIYAVWKKVGGVAVDTGKRSLSSQAVEEAREAAQASAVASADSAIEAQSAASNAAEEFQAIFDADQAERETEFNAFMASLGYESTYLVYGPGVIVERQTQLIQREGELYRVMNASDIPLNLTGTWSSDSPKLQAVGDAALRSTLASAEGAGHVGYGSRTVGDRLGDTVNPKDFGGVCDGERYPLSDRFATLAAAQAVYPHATSLTNTIDWAAFQAALNTGLPVRYSGTPLINKELKAVPGNVSITAEPGALIDATASDFVGVNAISCTGSITQIASLASNVTAGSHALPFATPHGLVPGDWICIWNPVGTSFSAFRSYYHAGEWVRVDKAPTTTTVNLTGSLYADYLAAGVQIYKLAKNDVTLIDVYVRSGTTATNTIFLESITRLRTRGLRANAQGEAGIVISKTPDGVLLDGSAFNPGTNGDDYGIITANSQNILVSGGQYHARRHGFAMGGYAGPGCVPCRNVVVNEATITNDQASGVHAADMHGNSENCWFVNSHVRGGGTWQGKNNGFVGGSISGMDIGCVIYSSEMLGGNFTLDGVALSTFNNPQSTGRGIIDVGGQNDALTAKTDGPVNLIVKNCTLNGKNLTNLTFFLLFRNAGSVNKISYDINGVNFNVNNMGFVTRSALDSGTASSNGFSIQGLSGNLPQGIALHGASSGTYTSMPHRLPGLTYTQTVTTSTSASFVIGTPIAYRYTYPKVPAVVVSTSKITFIGSITPIAGADPDTETGFTPSIRTPNASNFSAAVAVKLNCVVGLSEF